MAEIAHGARVGLRIDLDAIPISQEGLALCREFGLDPLGTIASGALLMAVEPGCAGEVQDRLAQRGYPAATIGVVTPAAEGLVALANGREVAWPRFEADEITKLFA